MATDFLWQNIPVVITIVTVRPESRNAQAVKSLAIADSLVQFPREEEFLLDDEVLGEVAMVEEVGE